MWAYERWSHWYRCQIKSFRDDEKRGPKKTNKQKKNVDADDNENEKSWPANRIEDFLSSGVEDDFFFYCSSISFFFIGGLEGTSSSSLGVTSVLTLRVKFAFEIGSGWARSIELEDELKLSSFTFNGFHGLNVRVDEAPHRRSIWGANFFLFFFKFYRIFFLVSAPDFVRNEKEKKREKRKRRQRKCSMSRRRCIRSVWQQRNLYFKK